MTERSVFEIRQKNPDGLMTGPNCEVLLDGKPLKGVMKLVLEVEAANIAKIHLTMVGIVNVIGKLSPEMLTLDYPKMVPKRPDETND